MFVQRASYALIKSFRIWKPGHCRLSLLDWISKSALEFHCPSVLNSFLRKLRIAASDYPVSFFCSVSSGSVGQLSKGSGMSDAEVGVLYYRI